MSKNTVTKNIVTKNVVSAFVFEQNINEDIAELMIVFEKPVNFTYAKYDDYVIGVSDDGVFINCFYHEKRKEVLSEIHLANIEQTIDADFDLGDTKVKTMLDIEVIICVRSADANDDCTALILCAGPYINDGYRKVCQALNLSYEEDEHRIRGLLTEVIFTDVDSITEIILTEDYIRCKGHLAVSHKLIELVDEAEKALVPIYNFDEYSALIKNNYKK